MDRKTSPDRLSPDHYNDKNSYSPEPIDQDSDNMATMVAHGHAPNMPGPVGGINKRYRPAPAKTFQCRGYGECRMVFSRSEHLARHIRKHTGERPFTCHCGKQFSRLDNLRQHAQTVHADKQDQNERMMRDLTSLHATMAAANKVGNPRGGRRPGAGAGGPLSSNSNGAGMNLIKQEDLAMPMHQRPGTSTGYEDGILYNGPTWHIQTSDIDRPNSRPTNNHSFRDPSQSFLAPSASNNTSTSSAAAQSQSFLPFTSTLSFSVPDSARDARPGSSTSRPLTSGGSSESHPRSLPPLSAVVSASISSPSSQQPFASPSSQQQQSSSQQQSSQHVLSFPGSLALRRPSTATRPGTAPAGTSLYSKPSYIGGPGMATRPELSLLPYGRGSELGSSHGGFDADLPQSPPGHDSPFYFSPPDAQPTTNTTSSPPILNPRKRAFAGPDGPYDDVARGLESGGLDYDYGSESRPQSRRLSVMELCNDATAASGPLGAFLLPTGSESRPNTSSGLVSSASTLTIIDRDSRGSPISPLLARAAHASAGAAATGGGGGGGSQEEFGGGSGVFASSIRNVPSPQSVLYYRPGAGQSAAATGAAFTHSPTFSASSPNAYYSPRSPSTTSSFSPRSPVSPSDASAAAAVSRRGHGDEHDQIRVALSSFPSAAFGMRV